VVEGLQPTLEVADLTVRFGGVLALDDVSLRIDPAEVVAIIGPNGAGKTTLFNAICGFVRPTSGRIAYRGEPLLGTATHRLARLGIARTLQGLGLWPGLTVLENVMAGSKAHPGFISSLLALPGADRIESELAARARATLDRLGVGSLASRYPSALPYGAQKRVIMARALMSNPSLLLLDEPASGLSSEEIGDLAALIKGLRAQMSVAVVEHHLDFVMSIADRVTVLNLGRVIASGTPQEIQSDPQVATAYLGEEVSAQPEAASDA
jgi:branched-chain amino acid transport system ATP-binding protein